MERTNSGEAILLMCSMKCDFHGAGPEEWCCAVVDIVRVREVRRWRVVDAIVAVFDCIVSELG